MKQMNEVTELTRGSIDRIGVMMDTESLGLKPNSVLYDWGFVVFDLDDPETILESHREYLPLGPQAQLGRSQDPATWLYHLDAGPVRIAAIREAHEAGDYDALGVLVRAMLKRFNRAIEGAKEYQVWFARPQHDIPLIASLLADVGEELPWNYQSVRDLRTLMDAAGLPFRGEEVESFKEGLTLHTSLGDCKFQIKCYIEALRRLRSRV
jgi:hypothetical protein